MKKKYGFTGDYSSFEEAIMSQEDSGYRQGYENKSISEAVLSATQKVRKGEALYERDSVLFHRKQWNYQLLSSLYYIEKKLDTDCFDIVDFGGAMGSSYFQHMFFVENNRWNIVEQESYVEVGSKEIPELSFYDTIDRCIKDDVRTDVLYVSSSLMYLDDPYAYIREFVKHRFSFVIIDRTYFNPNDTSERDRICVQNVPESIYDASYPAWLLSEKKFKEEFIRSGYKVIIEWYSTLENEDKERIALHEDDDKQWVYAKGLLLERDG